jgi:hypothetical protein
MTQLTPRAGLGAAAAASGAVAGLGSALSRREAVAPAGSRAVWTAAALLAASALADSAIEHYRGGFKNPGMYAPLAGSAAMLALAGVKAAGRPASSKGLIVCAAAGAIGAAGLGFHLYNVTKRPGGFSWHNLFYGAPLAAPAALALSGVLGFVAQAAGRFSRAARRRLLAGLGAIGLFGTVLEAGLLHFRGAFQNPFMWAPVTVPPLAATALVVAGAGEAPSRARGLARGLLAATAAVGAAGVGFHLFGISRAMGGWRNWRQNLIDGPPVPAPPAFSALALLGLTALAA